MRLRGAVCVIVAVLATGCQEFALRGPDAWYGVEVDEVRLLAQGPREDLDAIATELAAFQAAFRMLVGGTIESPHPTTMILIRERGLRERFGLVGPIAGYASTSLDGAISWIRGDRDPVSTRITLFHEYTHILLERNHAGPVPRWYNEGLATYFGTLGRREGLVVVGSVDAGRLVGVARGLMPIEKLVKIRLHEATAEEFYDFYATSWAFVHYLMGTPDGRAALSRFEKLLADGTPVDTARERAFERSWDAIESEVEAHVGFLRRAAPPEIFLDPTQVVPAEVPPSRPISEGEVAETLGSLALHLARWGGNRELGYAKRLLRSAVRADPTNARARAALGEALARSGDEERSAAVTSQAIQQAPDDVEVRVRAGRADLAGERFDSAQEQFRFAVERDARSAAAWSGLGLALRGAGRMDEALDAFSKSRQIAWSPEVDLEIGKLHLDAGRVEAATLVLLPIAQDPHGGAVAEEALKLLEGAKAASDDVKETG